MHSISQTPPGAFPPCSQAPCPTPPYPQLPASSLKSASHPQVERGVHKDGASSLGPPCGLQHQGQRPPMHGCSPVLLTGLKNSLPIRSGLAKKTPGSIRSAVLTNPRSPKQDGQLTVVPHKSPGLKTPLRHN